MISSYPHPFPPLPRVASDLAGTGGAIKQAPEDFEVEEIPAYEPSGDGEHLYLWIEKRRRSADDLVRHVARALGIPTRDIGTAGLKDTVAVTRQTVSVPASVEPRLANLDGDGFCVLSATRHRHKLRTGHLDGNRFRVVIRDVGPQALARAETIVARLRSTGVPNYFGPQRFGRSGETLELGRALLHGERPEGLLRAPRGRRRFLTRLALSAVQAALFNDFVVRRMEDSLLHHVIDGDVMQVTASGGLFVTDSPERERSRYAAGEVTPTGPMFGPKMRTPSGPAAERERSLRAGAGLTTSDFARYPTILRGTRRGILMRPADLSVRAVDAGLELRFQLPPGSYATVLLSEITQ